MPTNKPMQVQWREIDGRLVPFTLPQHWNGSNWVITGNNNPLPTADYGMTEGGLWVPKRVSDDGAQHTQLTGSNVEKGIPVQIEQDFIEVRIAGEGAVGAGKDMIFDVYSNPGEMWTLKRFGYRTSRTIDSEGEQLINIYQGVRMTNSEYVIRIKGDLKEFIRGTIPGYREAHYGGTVRPADPFELVETIRDTVITSSSIPLRIRYRNQGNMEINAPRFTLFFIVEKVNNVE